jgi:hypothetical protein
LVWLKKRRKELINISMHDWFNFKGRRIRRRGDFFISNSFMYRVYVVVVVVVVYLSSKSTL